MKFITPIVAAFLGAALATPAELKRQGPYYPCPEGGTNKAQCCRVKYVGTSPSIWADCVAAPASLASYQDFVDGCAPRHPVCCTTPIDILDQAVCSEAQE
ncbi:hypothetical protein F4782DRAFT_524456 [Xylaria castorea]|nr:hypothetical protein F4782DRAFT_524456 [Xylaria castorea]